MDVRITRLHALGFANYPTASMPAMETLQPHLFFYERILGSRELRQVYEALAGHCNLAITTERAALADVCEERRSLLKLRS